MSVLFSDAFADEMLAHFFGGSVLRSFSYREFSLWNGSPHQGGTETAGTDYVRQGYSDILDGSFMPGTGANGYAFDSQVQIGFPDNTGSTVSTGNWTQASFVGISDAASDPPIMALAMPSPVTILVGENIQFPPGSLKFELGTPETPWLISESWAHDLMEYLVGQIGTAPSAPATWYVSLWTGNPFAGGTEVSTSSSAYARLALTNAGAWTAPAANADGARAVTNVDGLRWPAGSGTATATWGTVLYIAFSTGSGTAPLFARKLPGAGRFIGNGGFLSVPIGGIELTLSSRVP